MKWPGDCQLRLTPGLEGLRLVRGLAHTYPTVPMWGSQVTTKRIHNIE
jgi:hypothetical protein